MSINNVPQDCQEIPTTIADTMRQFTGAVQSELALQESAASLQLSPEQLSLLLASWPHTPHAVAVVTQFSPEKNRQLQQYIDAWQRFLGTAATWHLLQGTLSEQEREGSVITELTEGLHHFLAGTPGHRVIIAHEDMPVLPSRQEYQALILELHSGERISLTELGKLLAARGYVRHATTLEPGSFVVRGEQVGFWHPAQNPHRLTLYGTTVEHIVESAGKRTWSRHKVKILPLRVPAAHAPLADAVAHLPVFRPSLCPACIGTATIIYDTVTPTIPFPFLPLPPEHESLPHLPRYYFAQNIDRVTQYAHERDDTTIPVICKSTVSEIPIIWRGSDTILVSEAALFADRQPEEEPLSYAEGLQMLAELKEGKPAVHSDHGIGIYEGLQSRQINSVMREYIVLRYADGDMLSVPVELAYKVTAYVGDVAPTIHKLGGSLWVKTSRQAKRDAIAFAQELLKTARQREHTSRDNFLIDAALENKLATSFPYTLTDGQAAAWTEVRRDLQRRTPMDRLIVGDVGFGKTEIAIRAAAHAAANGRQVAVIAPTTLLVQQHFDTFVQRLSAPRLSKVPFNPAMLSRFTSPTQQKAAREAIAEGKSLVAIGTHALLSRSVTWKNLGLVIIDEEQRFGVVHKEHFKKLRASVDMLSLSATPIPRTLSMALTGLKGLSIIASPPLGRRDIKSFVGKDHDAILTRAVTKEIVRGGQVYVVLPRIQGLHALAQRINQLVPKASVAVAHGQMPSPQLAQIMHDFDHGNLQVLVSSTIIENGLDLPNANTLIVLQATHFGLSELYQLRGRVGRRSRQGYAYFLYRQSELTSLQRRRLTVLTETSRLGSGWALAQRDLELRGAGNLLGAEQSGTVKAVGIQLYLDMVREVISEGAGIAARPEVEIHVPFPTYVPAHYLADLTTRLKYYQQLSRARTEAEIDRLVEKIMSTYGELPEEVTNLLLALKLQLAAGRLNIQKISYQTITPRDEPPYSRLIVDSADPLPVLNKVGSLGNWVVRGHSAQWDVAAITPALIQQLTDALAAPSS